MLINCTNHPYEIWNEGQRTAAEQYGEVVDLPFPQIDPMADTDALRALVDEYVSRIEALHGDVVLAAGEFTFLFMLVDRLLTDGVKVICTCSRRNTVEVKNADGTNEKKAVFFFEQFRPYAYYVGREGSDIG